MKDKTTKFLMIAAFGLFTLLVIISGILALQVSKHIDRLPSRVPNPYVLEGMIISTGALPTTVSGSDDKVKLI